MPTYDYECKRCKHRFEAFHSMTAEALTKCPECGRRSLQRLIGAGAGIIFKGSGFYITDYKRGSSGGDGSSSEPSEPAGSVASESGSSTSGSSGSDSSESKSSD